MIGHRVTLDNMVGFNDTGACREENCSRHTMGKRLACIIHFCELHATRARLNLRHLHLTLRLNVPQNLCTKLDYLILFEYVWMCIYLEANSYYVRFQMQFYCLKSVALLLQQQLDFYITSLHSFFLFFQILSIFVR